MNKEFELNGVKVELSKEKLQEMLKEFNKTTWTINKFFDGEIVLKKNGKFERRLINFTAGQKRNFVQDFNKLTFIIAEAMGYLAIPEHMLDEDEYTYQVCYNAYDKIWNWASGTNYIDGSYIIDTDDHANEIVKLLNESTAIKEWLEYVKGDK